MRREDVKLPAQVSFWDRQREEWTAMETFLITLLIIILLIGGGILISWRLFRRRLQETRGFRRIRRVRRIRPLSDGTTVEETIIETTPIEPQVPET
jgi:hypothetical protein